MLSAPDREDEQAHPGPGDERPSSGPWARWRRWILAVSVALLAVPLGVAVLAQRHPQWFPVLDLAMTELRVKDVFTRHTPLIGLPGRIGDFPDQGSHPGPLSFYALAPFYRLLGASSWALQAATAIVNLIACTLALWIGRRRGGAPMVAAVFLLLASLVAGYGVATLTEPWNPLMPLLWWVVLLLAVWAVLCRDFQMLPIAVLAASFCAQTHVPYLGLSIGIGVVAIVGLIVFFLRASAGSEQRRRVVRWGAISVALAGVLWLPPAIDQVTGSTHNVSMLARHFTTDPPEERIGFVDGGEWLLVNLNPLEFARGGEGFDAGPLVAGGPLVGAAQDPESSLVPGAVLLAAWAIAVAVAVRRRHGELLRLHAVIGVGLALGLFSLSNVFGKQWYYLSLWTWALVALMVGSIAWTILVAVRDRVRENRRASLADWTGVAMFVIAALIVASAAVRATDTDPPDPMLSEVLGEVVGPTADALETGTGPAQGRDGTYLVSWSDVYFIGSQGYGLVLELERLGFDVGVTETFRVPVTPQRVLELEDVTAEVHLATGFMIDEIATRPGAVEVVRVDPRSTDEVMEFDRLRGELIEELGELGFDDLVPLVDENLFAVPIDPRLPVSLERKALRLLQLGQPTAIFLVPTGS